MLERQLLIKYTNNTLLEIDVVNSDFIDKQLDRFIKAINKRIYESSLINVKNFFYMSTDYYIAVKDIQYIRLLDDTLELTAKRSAKSAKREV